MSSRLPPVTIAHTALLSLSLGGCTGAAPPPDAAAPPADVALDGGSPADTGATADTGPGGDAGPTADAWSADSGLPSYLVRCESFFAARIVELQVEEDASFPSDCEVPLRSDIARLGRAGLAMCMAGESANACRNRLYETPPDLDDLSQACWGGSGPDNCMHASWLPRCADGGDACTTDEVVCQDGTRPMIYAEAATSGPSDVWLFHLGGEGGPCSGAGCWLNYRFGDAAFARAMSTLHPDAPSAAARVGSGILNGSGSLPYARLNRVGFERCTDAASHAEESAPVANGVPAELASMFPDAPIATAAGRVPVWHHGLDAWLAAFHHLTTMEGRDRDGDGTPELPSLADARLVIVSGSSDASTWVTLAADRLAAELRSIAGPDVEVRMLVDGMFPPMLDSAGRSAPGAPASFDAVSDSFRETGLCQLPDNHDGVANETCSSASYQDGGRLWSSYRTRGVFLDESCEAMHGVGAPDCFDRNHTLVHHLDVPVLILADQEDNTVSDGAPIHALDSTYRWETPSAYRQQILQQAWDLVDSWGTDAREEGPGPDGGLVLILPKARREGEPWARATHVRAHDDGEMARAMTFCSDSGADRTVTFNQMLAGWVAGTLPQTFAIEDASHPLPGGNAWVTGASCRAPE